MVPHPDHLARLLNSRQLADWEAYVSIEPRGERREDARMARVCATIAQVQGVEDATDDRFELVWERPEPPPTPEELAEKIKARFAVMGCRGLSERVPPAGG